MEYFLICYINNNAERFCIWNTNDKDGLCVDENNKIISLAEIDSAMLYLLNKGFSLHDKSVISTYDFDKLRFWIGSDDAAVDCNEILDLWNLFNDVSCSTGLKFSGDKKNHTTDRIYNKLFFGCNLPAIKPDNEEDFVPYWSRKEIKIMKSVLEQGLNLFLANLILLSELRSTNESNDIFETNRAAWNEALEYHQKARNNSLQIGFENPNFTTLDRDCDDVLLNKLSGIDLNGKTISQMPCNNGRELLSLMRFGTKEAVGFDISDTAVSEARQLAKIAKLNAKFVRTNILEIGEEYNGYFDFIYISEGSLQWFPDLNEYFSVASRLLKPNGRILIFEMHPFAYFFENALNEKQSADYATSYFDKGPYSYKNGLDYVGEVRYDAKESCWFMHKISDIINAVLHNSIAIEEFNEYNLEMANDPEQRDYDKFPLSYILMGKRG